MIRLLHVLPFMGLGGTERMVLQLCQARDAGLFDASVVPLEPGPMEEEFRKAGIRLWYGASGLTEALAWSEIINLHLTCFDPYLHELVYRSGRPYVLTVHCQSVIPAIPAVTICTSHALGALQPDRSRSVTIPNAVDLRRFPPRPPRDGSRVVLIRVCRPDRCALYFWEAMRTVLSRNAGAELWIVGNQAAGRAGDPRIRFFGLRPDVAPLLAEADLFVYTPVPGIGTKDLVVMEAMATGLPCIVPDVDSVRESVIDGKTGLMFAPEATAAFAECAERLIRDPALRGRLAAAAQEHARAHFDIRDAARRYDLVLHAVWTQFCRGGTLPHPSDVVRMLEG